MSQIQSRGREGLKTKMPKSRRQSQSPSRLAGRPAPADKRCPHVSSAMAGRPAPAPAHAGARTKHRRGSRGGAGPGVQPRSGHGERGGRRTLRGLRHRHKMAATSGSGSAPSPRWRPPRHSPTARLKPVRTHRRGAPAMPPSPSPGMLKNPRT